jgi:CubicO group peptidase (beta-lactamase class C family)
MKKANGFLLFILICFGISFFTSINLNGQDQNASTFIGYGDATYSGITENEFLKNWLILEPVKISFSGSDPSTNEQKGAFDKDPITEVQILQDKPVSKIYIDNTEYSWRSYNSFNGVVDFVKLFGQVDYAIGYAIAEIKMDAPSKVVVGVGSDDGIKIFLNGNLVHTNWITRGVRADEDLVILDLKKGSNQLLVKLQNMDRGWGFVIHSPEKKQLVNTFVKSAGNGNLDQVKILLNSGIDINSTNEAGLTAYQYAMIQGREKICSLLKEKGAKTDLPLPGLDKFISNIFINVQKDSLPGAAVLVAQNGDIIYQNGFGYADVENKIPITTDAIFKIGSISKQFTAAAILKLQEEGKISTEDKLSKYIPDFPRGDEVTIYQLLTHTSGIHNYEYSPNFLLLEPISPEALIKKIKTFPYDFNPGERYQYNNSGYFILGYLVTKISGRSLGEYLNEIFFKPLEMNNTGIYESGIKLKNEASEYSLENGTVKKAVYQDMSWALGVGNIYSTVKDLYRWNEAIFNGKVLSEKSMNTAFTQTVLNNNKKVDYGYGWMLSPSRGMLFIGHSGMSSGFTSYLERQPENNLTVCILCNSRPTPEGINPISNSKSISEFILWNKMEKQPTFDLDTLVTENILKKYVGRYNYGNGAVILVTLKEGQLYGQLTGQPWFILIPYSSDGFYVKGAETTFKFVIDTSGVDSYVIQYQGGQQSEIKKMKDETPISINPDVFVRLIGKYDFGGNFVVEIAKENNKLFGMAPNMPKFELLPISESDYFIQEASFRIKFILNKKGEAKSIILDTDGRIISGNRVD